MYILAPFIAWCISGFIKFCINYYKYGSEAKAKIGNGGFPSTHTTIMITTTTLISWSEGINTPLVGLALAISFIVVIDALGLRRLVGSHAAHLNIRFGLTLRESVGHNKIEILGGVILGIVLGTILYFVFD